MHKKLGLEKITAFSLMAAINAGMLIIATYYLLYAITKRHLDSLIFISLLVSSGSFVFWAHIPESFAFGATTILVPFLILSVPMLRSNHHWHLVANIVSLSLTTTNWMAGLASTSYSLGIKNAAVVAAKALVVVAAIWSVQKFLFPSAGFFLDLVEEQRYIRPANWPFAMRQFVFDSFSPLAVQEGIATWKERTYPTLRLSSDVSQSINVSVFAAWGVWLSILCYGFYHACRERGERSVGPVLALFVCGQFVLHCLYGTSETFIYSLHWMPTLVMIAAFGTRGKARTFLLPLVLCLAVYSAPRNYEMRAETIHAAEGFQQHVLQARAEKQLKQSEE